MPFWNHIVEVQALIKFVWPNVMEMYAGFYICDNDMNIPGFDAYSDIDNVQQALADFACDVFGSSSRSLVTCAAEEELRLQHMLHACVCCTFDRSNTHGGDVISDV